MFNKDNQDTDRYVPLYFELIIIAPETHMLTYRKFYGS